MKKVLSTSALALMLTMSAAPLTTLAKDGADDSSVEASVEVKHDGPGDRIRAGIRGLFGDKHEGRMEGEDRKDMMGSSTENKGPRMMEDRQGRKDGMMGSSTDNKGPRMMEDKGMKGGAHMEESIDARIARLNALITRIEGAERLSDSVKASLTAELQAQVTALGELKASVGTDASSTVKDRMHEIRGFMLTLPKAAITAAADRIVTITGQMETFSTKLSARIDAAHTAGTDTTAASASLTDFNSHVASAKVHAQAAASAVADLSDNSKTDANVAVLKDAKADIDAAQADLKAARKDIGDILKSIHGKGEVKVEAGN